MRLGAGADAWGIIHASHPWQIDWLRYLDEVCEAGFQVLEPGQYGYFPPKVARVISELTARDLRVAGGTFFGAISERSGRKALFESLDRAADWFGRIGASYLILLDDFYRDPSSGTRKRSSTLTEADWDEFVDTVHRIGERALEDHGLAVVFHPHCDATIERESDIERFLDATDEGLVSLCLDTGHHAYSGGDPVAFFRRHHLRIPYVHLKSMNRRILETVKREDWPWGVAVAHGVTDELERGIVDVPSLAEAMRGVKYSGFAIVEQDMFPCDPSVPLPLAKRTVPYLRNLGFVT